VGVTAGLSTRFGNDRVKSTPISEQAIMGAAIGASLIGFKPVAEIMLMNFTAVAMDMIVNHAAKLRYMSGGQTSVPIVIRCMTGAGLSTGGQHSDYLEAWFAHTAGMKVVAPSNTEDAYGLMRSAIDDPDPVLIIENTPSYGLQGPAPQPGYRVPIGKAAIRTEGSDITIVSYSRSVVECTNALAAINEAGISAELIDLRSIQPWDEEAVIAPSPRPAGRSSSMKRCSRSVQAPKSRQWFRTGCSASSRRRCGAWARRSTRCRSANRSRTRMCPRRRASPRRRLHWSRTPADPA
jgi:pyruvate/2-oxoglutarate/acetoin dehydrogenase E1 component